MRHKRTPFIITASFALAIACGGSTTFSSASGGSGGAATGGTSGSGGAATGGTSGSGGAATGGTSGSGGISGSGGAAGSGGSGDWYACSTGDQCELFATNCCGGYCSSTAPLSGWVALNTAHESDYQAAMCTTGAPCPTCASAPMPPQYLALCRTGKCTAVDLRTDSLSACSNDSDCQLRWGSGCCEQCNTTDVSQLTAINKNANFTHAVCGNQVPPCCAPAPYPANAVAVCNAGHCGVTFYVGP